MFSGSINRININDTNISDTFIKKHLRLIIKNSSERAVKFYSIFPGNSNIALIEDNRDAYIKTIGNYERVPLIINNQMSPQYLGQWIYFRQNNPYTNEDVYLNESQNLLNSRNNYDDIDNESIIVNIGNRKNKYQIVLKRRFY